MTVTGVSAASQHNGAVTLANGVITYLPPTNYLGSDSFTYYVSDGSDTVSGTVAVSVQPGDPNRNRLGPPGIGFYRTAVLSP